MSSHFRARTAFAKKRFLKDESITPETSNRFTLRRSEPQHAGGLLSRRASATLPPPNASPPRIRAWIPADYRHAERISRCSSRHSDSDAGRVQAATMPGCPVTPHSASQFNRHHPGQSWTRRHRRTPVVVLRLYRRSGRSGSLRG